MEQTANSKWTEESNPTGMGSSGFSDRTNLGSDGRAAENCTQRECREEVAPDVEKIRQLQKLRAIGPVGSWVLVREFFGWRHFKNRRQVGSLAGLTPTPYQSGETNADQGISKAGIVPVRQIAIELAWGWLRYQPGSKLTRWYHTRFTSAGKKARKVGIVALARKLLIELWRYLETGVIPEGAELKTA